MPSLFLALLLSSTAPALCVDPPIQELGAGDSRVGIIAAQLLEDASRKLSFDEILRPTHCADFEPAGKRIDEEIASRSAFWLRFRIATDSQDWLLHLRFFAFDRLCVYWPIDDGLYTSDCSGLQVPVEDRSVRHHQTLFPIPRDLDASRSVYLQAESASRFSLRPELVRTTTQLSDDHRLQIRAGLYHGLLLTTALFGLMFAIGMRDRASLFFSFHITCFSLAMSGFDGRAWEWIWPWLGRGSHFPPTILLAASGLFGALYGREYLLTRQHSPGSDRLLLGAALFAFVSLPAMFLSLGSAEQWAAASLLFFVLSLATAGIVRARQGERAAWYLLVGLSGAIIGAIAKSLEVLGLIDLPWNGARITRIGIAVGAIVMTLGLTRRLEQLRRDRDRAAEEAAAQQRIALYRAYRDETTGLPNRARLRTEIATELTRSMIAGGTVAVLVLDIDHFRASTETLSQRVVDSLIQGIAVSLRQGTRERTLLARLDQDRFAAAVLFDSSIEAAELEARDFANRLLENLAPTLDVEGQTLSLSATVGIALSPRDGQTADELLRSCAAAIYYARVNRTGPIEFFSSPEGFDTADRLALKSDLPLALENGEFEVHYQPQHDLQTGEVVGVEALVRWRHPERGLLQPGDFIDIAEETELITAIDEWVLRTACHDLSRSDARHLELPKIAVNVSAQDFRSPDFVSRVATILESEPTEPDRIELELTESLLVADPVATGQAIRQLRLRGLRTCIDDFGTGYSSLSYIRDFRVDGLKIDRSFVARVGESEETKAIVGTIVGLGRHLGLSVTAEGVEQPNQIAALRSLRCRSGQGYLWARPMPFDALMEYLRITVIPSVSGLG